MLIVVTGLDGSGTSTIAKKISEMDKGSVLLKTPSQEYSDRNNIDISIRKESITAHFLYYLSSTVYMSDYIKNNLDYKNNNIYCVRYLIDTVVSNRVAGVNVDLDYNIYGNELLKPDLTLFVSLDEKIRQQRITDRGKSVLDKVLDDDNKRKMFIKEFENLLPEETLFINNNGDNIENTIQETYFSIKKIIRENDGKIKTLKPSMPKKHKI